jgi:hypothetical protein
LGPRMLVTKDFGTQIPFFLVSTIEVPTNLGPVCLSPDYIIWIK